MARASEPTSPLVLAAQALEDGIRRCEKAVEEAARLRLASEKNIGRAAQALQSASAEREAVGGKVNALLAAIQASHARMQEAARRMEARALELQARVKRLETLQGAAADIGGALRELTDFAKGTQDAASILERIGPVEERIQRGFEEARAEGFEDVARDLAAMRDMLAALRRKLQSL